MRLALCGLAAVLWSQAAFAALARQDLDAPIDQKPTVRSELRRGFAAGDACDHYDIFPQEANACFARLKSQNLVSHTNSDAFELGLAVRKWQVLDRWGIVAANGSGNLAHNLQLEVIADRAEAKLEILNKLVENKLTFEQVAAAVTPNSDILERWALFSQPDE